MFYKGTQHQQTRLQRITNKAAIFVININSLDHYIHHSSQSSLIQFHWPSVQSKRILRISLLTFISLSTSTLIYLSNLIQQKPNTKYFVLQLPHSSSKDMPQTTYQKDLSKMHLLLSETSYHQREEIQFFFQNLNLKHIYLN